MDWNELTSNDIQKTLDVIKDEKILPKVAFLAVEDFFEKADEEALYKFMVQMRLQLMPAVTDETDFSKRLDIIANYGVQSKTYMDGMKKAFIYIEREGKPLPAPPT